MNRPQWMRTGTVVMAGIAAAMPAIVDAYVTVVLAEFGIMGSPLGWQRVDTTGGLILSIVTLILAVFLAQRSDATGPAYWRALVAWLCAVGGLVVLTLATGGSFERSAYAWFGAILIVLALCRYALRPRSTGT